MSAEDSVGLFLMYLFCSSFTAGKEPFGSINGRITLQCILNKCVEG
jgi:hypothetical protein